MKQSMKLIYVLIVLLLIIVVINQSVWCHKSNVKRILVNDPDVLSHQIGTLTQKLTTLESQVKTLQTEKTNMETKIDGLTKTIQTLQTEKSHQQMEIDNLTKAQNENGVMYVRWGKKSCPTNGTELIYSGFTAGNSHRSGGGVATTVCLPQDPTWGKQTEPSYSYVAIEGAEYEDNFFGPNTRNEDIPCALCRKPKKSSIVMIPGRTSCYPGLSTEYNGYLAGGLLSSPSDYICIDENPDFVMGGEGNDDTGREFFPAKVFCGPLPCPPYHDGKLVACALCSK